MTQRVTQRTGCLAATCGHVTSVTSLLPYRGKAGSCSPVYPINIDFLSYKIHLAKNLEHFQDNIDNCLSRWMRVLSFFLWLLAAIKLRLARTSTATRAELTLDTLFARDIARP